jgi:abortive infection bacteriophage resistance protein
LSYLDQAKLIESRGMQVEDRALLLRCLEGVGYYRLCAYWHPFKNPDSTFAANTSFNVVWRRYRFDRQLRLLVMDAIERVEVAVRTALVHELAMRAGPFAHTTLKSFPGVKPERHAAFLQELRKQTEDSSEVFVEHFRQNYDEFPDIPVWAVCETMTFGAMFTLFNMTERRTRNVIARRFGVHGPVLLSWLRTLNYVRNICAHHARLWNRELALQPVLPNEKNDDRWYGAQGISTRRIFVVLTILHQLLREIAPQSQWRNRLYTLFDAYPDIPLKPMGIPEHWRSHALWK